tara:strand:+ start:488 stop:1492 length:1005 start_codon:yes stop_codon:yes gene_type:complete
MKKYFLTLVLFYSGCEDNKNLDQNQDLLFISSEGNYGDSDGSISVFKGDTKIQTLHDIGDVVQSILVDENKLFVIINNSHLIKRYTITETGLKLPGIEISTNNSSPREMAIIDEKLYFTNWSSKDVKILDLNTFSIEDSIKIDGLPEDIITDGNSLWITIPSIELYDPGYGTSVIQIDPQSKNIMETFEVGNGPQNLLLDGGKLWISRTFYSPDWSTAYYGTSSIDLSTKEVKIKTYGTGMICGGNLLKLNNQVYRTVNGGVAPLDQDLEINLSSKLGSYPSLYSAFSVSENLYLGRSDGISPDSIFVHNENGDLQYNLIVGAYPGDYEFWKPN